MPSSKRELKTELKAGLRVSVVLCTYNGTRFLQKQLQSLRDQTLQPFELVVCDDQSTDSTLQLLESFRQEVSFPVHVMVNEVNLGSTRNFEQALQRASGEFLALCDQDDIWFPEKLATLALALQRNPRAGGVFSDALLLKHTATPEAADPEAADPEAADPGAADPGAADPEAVNPEAVESSRQAKKTLWQLHGFDRRQQERFLHGGAIDLLLKHDVVTGATLMIRGDLRDCWTPIPVSWVHDGWIAWMLVLYSTLLLVPRPLIHYRVHAQQQLGVGGSSRRARIQVMRQTERARYARVADQFEDLRQRLRPGDPAHHILDGALRQKIALLRRRSQLPHGLLSRIGVILANSPLYWRYARGWRSMRKDLLLS